MRNIVKWFIVFCIKFAYVEATSTAVAEIADRTELKMSGQR